MRKKENRPAIGSNFRIERGRTVWLYECQFPKRNLLTIGKISVSSEVRRLKYGYKYPIIVDGVTFYGHKPEFRYVFLLLRTLDFPLSIYKIICYTQEKQQLFSTSVITFIIDTIKLIFKPFLIRHLLCPDAYLEQTEIYKVRLATNHRTRIKETFDNSLRFQVRHVHSQIRIKPYPASAKHETAFFHLILPFFFSSLIISASFSGDLAEMIVPFFNL